ncbi:MAG: hypothetical protein K5899_10800 [Bacteroidaceae bacterium]|nr:hypothetical protein [Bacteroidaceae bacterium]
MKKLLFIAMIIASVAAKAQTFYNSQGIIPILMGDSVVFDLTEYPFYGLSIELNRMESDGTYTQVYDIGGRMQSAANSQTNKWIIPYTNYNNPSNSTISTVSFPIAIGGKYSVTYSIPHVFHYKHYYYYYLNHNSIFIYLCPISSTGEIMGRFTVAEIPISVSMVQADDYYHTFLYWDCMGLNNSESNVSFYTHNGLMTAHRIQPSVDFTDLWYTEYDEEPRDPNWRQHYTFVDAIHHFAIGFGFGS